MLFVVDVMIGQISQQTEVRLLNDILGVFVSRDAPPHESAQPAVQGEHPRMGVEQTLTPDLMFFGAQFPILPLPE
jgi:hypothetical protein